MANEKPEKKPMQSWKEGLGYVLMGIGGGLTGTDAIGNFLKWKAQQDEANEIDPWVDLKNRELDIKDRELSLEEKAQREEAIEKVKNWILALKEEHGGDYEKALKDVQGSMHGLARDYGIGEEEVMGLFGEQFKPNQKVEKVVNLPSSVKGGIALGAGALALSPTLRQSVLGGGARALGIAGQIARPVTLGALTGNAIGSLAADLTPQGALQGAGDVVGQNAFLRWLAMSRPQLLGGMNQEERGIANQIYGSGATGRW